MSNHHVLKKLRIAYQCISSDSNNIIIAGDTHGSVLVFNLGNLFYTTLNAPGHSSAISSIDWNPFLSNSFLTSGKDNNVKLWTIGERNHFTVNTYRNDERIHSAIWKPDQLNIFACAGSGILRTYDTRMPNFATINVGVGESFGSCDWCKHGGNCIATADQFRRCIRVWDIRYIGHPDRVHHIEPQPATIIHTSRTLWKVKFSPHQNWQIASCSKNSEVALWDSRVDDPPIDYHFHHVGHVFGLDMSIGFDMSTLIASTGQDRTGLFMSGRGRGRLCRIFEFEDPFLFHWMLQISVVVSDSGAKSLQVGAIPFPVLVLELNL